MSVWVGVDVGGPRKGFDVAVVDGHRLLEVRSGLDVAAVVAIVEAARPTVVGIDSPSACAGDGETTRASERQVNREVCGIRWTPNRAGLDGNPYYSWIVHGLALYAALEGHATVVIEVFPTASWTRWAGARRGRPRAAWTTEALAALGLAGVPARTNQDQRDAIAAAVTARQHTLGRTEMMGDIAIPIERSHR